jgi:hypothetical protein
MPASAPKTPEAVYDALAAEQLRQQGVTVGRALQNDVLKVDDKIFAFLKGERLVVKIPAAQVAALVAAGEAVPFETGGGRKMKEWAAVTLIDTARWRALMNDARTFVASVNSTQKKPAKTK